MKKFTPAALGVLLLTACTTPGTPPSITLNVTTNPKVQNVLNVKVQVTGNGLRQVTLLRDSTDDQTENYAVLKQVNAAPFDFTLDDSVPGNGVYLYRVTASNGEYLTTTDQKVTYEYTVGAP